MCDDFELERFSRDSIDRETSFNESYFDTLVSNEDVEGDRAISSMLTSSIVAGI